MDDNFLWVFPFTPMSLAISSYFRKNETLLVVLKAIKTSSFTKVNLPDVDTMDIQLCYYILTYPVAYN